MADFYGTTAGYRAYQAARGRTIDAGVTDAIIQAALQVGSEWLDGHYGPAWSDGWTFKTGQRAQIREWPRTGFVDYNGYAIANDEIPREVENSTYEATQRQIASAGSLTVDFAASQYKSAQVDGAVKVEYNIATDVNDLQPQIAIINQILYPLLKSPYAGGNLSGMSGVGERV